MREYKNTHRYEIEADWVINDFCNYSCDYCFFHSTKENKFVGRFSSKDYLNFFDSTGKIWLFHITGGEPLFYPKFSEFCRDLTKTHYLALNSNLASNEIFKFVDLVDPVKVEYIHCGVHPEQRESHDGEQKLFEKMKVLLYAGFPLFASVVMKPTIFERFERLLRLFTTIGVPLLPKVIRGNYLGQPYPESYSSEERKKIKEFAEIAEEIGKKSPWRPFRNNPTINPLLDKYFLDGFPDFRGELCTAGMNFVRIKPDGSVFRCGKKSPLGNLIEQKIDFYPDAKPCNDTACPYICIRYSHGNLEYAQNLPKRVTGQCLLKVSNYDPK